MTSLSVQSTGEMTWRDYHTLPLSIRGAAGALVLELPKKLESPNQVIWGHWRKLGGERKAWESLIYVALTRDAASGGARAALPLRRCGHQMRIAIDRYVASTRQFIRDDDNLVFAAKPLHDALTRVGLIYDDRRDWLSASPITQRVSVDGRPRTVVSLWPVETSDV